MQSIPATRTSCGRCPNNCCGLDKSFAGSGLWRQSVGVDIKRLSPDDEAGCVDAVALHTAAAKVDCPEEILPTPKGFANGLRYGWDLNPGHAYLARDTDGTVLGQLHVHYPKWENLNQAWFGVVVHPEHRRRGIG